MLTSPPGLREANSKIIAKVRTVLCDFLLLVTLKMTLNSMYSLYIHAVSTNYCLRDRIDFFTD